MNNIYQKKFYNPILKFSDYKIISIAIAISFFFFCYLLLFPIYFFQSNNMLLKNDLFKIASYKSRFFDINSYNTIFSVSYAFDANYFSAKKNNNEYEFLSRLINNNNLQNYVSDASGSVLKLNDYTDNTNNETYSYDAYGKTINTVLSSHQSYSAQLTQERRSISALSQRKKKLQYNDFIPNHFKYNDESSDDNTNLIYLRARFYSSTIKIFITEDSYDFKNKFNFTNLNPIMKVDQSGHNSFPRFKSSLFNIGRNKLLISIDKSPRLRKRNEELITNFEGFVEKVDIATETANNNVKRLDELSNKITKTSYLDATDSLKNLDELLKGDALQNNTAVMITIKLKLFAAKTFIAYKNDINEVYYSELASGFKLKTKMLPVKQCKINFWNFIFNFFGSKMTIVSDETLPIFQSFDNEDIGGSISPKYYSPRLFSPLTSAS